VKLFNQTMKGSRILFSCMLLFVSIWIIKARKDAKGAIHFKRNPFILNVKDKRTKEPITGALVKLRWNKGWGGSYGGVLIKEMVIMTDRKGKVNVPGIDTFLFLYVFDNLSIDVYHPVYQQLLAFGKENMYPLSTTYGYTRPWSYINERDILCEMDNLKDIFAETHCVVESDTPVIKEECKGSDLSLNFLLMRSREYYWILKKDKIVGLNNEFVPEKEKVAESLQKIAEAVYRESIIKPAWIRDIKYLVKDAHPS